jgi:hypothetical protein
MMVVMRSVMLGVCIPFVLLTLLPLCGGFDLCAADLPVGPRDLECSIACSRYIVDPDAGLNLWGLTGEVRLQFDREIDSMLSRQVVLSREITLGCTKVLRGDIDALLVGLTYGPRFDFSRFHHGFGAGPFTSYMFSDRKTDVASGYTLKTGWRFEAYYYVGVKLPVTVEYTITMDLKYNFTVQRVKWHNPFVSHKHDDMFSSLSLHVGVRL